jgi:hypothetical protein
MEKKLLAHGFTEKEVNRLKKVLASEHAGDDNLQSLILELKKGFIPSCICILVVLLLYPFIVTEPNMIELTAYLITATIAFFSINRINPMKLSYKAYMLFFKKK